jgi:hypothetical protein
MYRSFLSAFLNLYIPGPEGRLAIWFFRVWVVIIEPLLYNIFSNLKRKNIMRKIPAVFLLLAVSACNSPPGENSYRKEGRYPSNINVPVAFLVSEWAGKPRVLASGWLIDGGNGTLFSAKHFSDDLMSDTIEFGANECKVFLSGRVYSCIVVQVPPLRDAVVFRILGLVNQGDLPMPYKISTEKLKVGDKVFVQGFHTHPSEITKSNMDDGLKDVILPILETFYGLREADPSRQREVVFDSLEATVVKIDDHIKINNQENDPSESIRFKSNEYIKVITSRNHKFSFGGLSGGVVVKINDRGVAEAVGIVTAERPERLRYNKKGRLEGDPPAYEIVSDTVIVTPIYSVKDLYDYARQGR